MAYETERDGRPALVVVLVVERGREPQVEREQVGVRVVLGDVTVVDLDQGVTYEVRHTENLHVLRGERRVSVFRAGSWRYAERIFGDEVVANA